MVYSKRSQTPMQTQEFELMADPTTADNQKEDEVNEPCCEEEEWVNDIDLPIATRKGVRSCTEKSGLSYIKLCCIY